MSSDSESEVKPPNGVAAEEGIGTPIEPSTPQEAGPQELSQMTLPSTEAPASPDDDVAQSFRTEVNEDRVARTVIPSSLTPPPSTQVAPQDTRANGDHLRRTRLLLSQSQESNFVSPPATINNNIIRGRDVTSDYTPPSAAQVRDGSADELRAMLQTCIAEHQKLKMETAHHRLQYNLLSLQASEESNRSEVELEMQRREIEALRSAEHSRQAKHELSTFSQALQAKYLDVKADCDELLAEVDALSRRLRQAKKIIQDKDDEVMSLVDERNQLLNRIRENREHMNKLRSPGGIFHGAATPSRGGPSSSSPAHSRAAAAPRGLAAADMEGGGGLSTLLEALSQDNNSEPSTPMTPRRPPGRQQTGGRGHQRNAQSMSSLPTTPVGKPRGAHASLLPSADLVPQTEPPQKQQSRYRAPRQRAERQSHARRRDGGGVKGERRGSRESTISASSNNAAAADDDDDDYEEDDAFAGSQASRAAADMLRRTAAPHGGSGFDASSSPGGSGSAHAHARLLSNIRGEPDKRKFSGQHEAPEGPASPGKRTRLAGGSAEQQRLGLGIRYG